MKRIILSLTFMVFLLGCKEKNDPHANHKTVAEKSVYTCPMHPEIISDKPGKCPKCGMDLVKKESRPTDATYTCPMHPEVISDKPGKCPKCGMDLVVKENTKVDNDSVGLETLLKPTNEFVISGIPVTVINYQEIPVEIDALGNVEYDTRTIGGISSRVEGRIEKLYVRHRYQAIRKGQHILDIYSPELLTAQQNLLFLLTNDKENAMVINAARQKLLLLGMSAQQIQRIVRRKKPDYSVAVYSNYTGHIHDAGGNNSMAQNQAGTNMSISPNTLELSIKEGMYVKRGQTIFSVFNAGRVWALLNIFADNVGSIQKGQQAIVIPETAPDRKIRGNVNFVEPFFRSGSKTLSVRVYFDNSRSRIPIGSQVRAKIFAAPKRAQWLPKEAIVSLGVNKVVFQKSEGGFIAKSVKTGIELDNKIEIISGLTNRDSVASNAQYLMDSESFIKLANK